MSKTADKPQLLLKHHLKQLKLPTFLAEYEKQAYECAQGGVDQSSVARGSWTEANVRSSQARSPQESQNELCLRHWERPVMSWFIPELVRYSVNAHLMHDPKTRTMIEIQTKSDGCAPA